MVARSSGEMSAGNSRGAAERPSGRRYFSAYEKIAPSAGRSGFSISETASVGAVRTETLRSKRSGRFGSTTAPSRRSGDVASSATAVSQSSTTSMPIEEPPNRGLTM